MTTLRVVRGEPTPEELAVVIALASAAGGEDESPAEPARGRWNDPAICAGRPPVALRISTGRAGAGRRPRPRSAMRTQTLEPLLKPKPKA